MARVVFVSVPRQALLSGLLLGSAASLTGCYTTANTVKVTPFETKYPVSLSSAYVEQDGRVCDDKGYEVVRSFSFDTTVQGPRHEETTTRLALEPELDREVAGAGGNAVTNLRIQGVDYDPGSHGAAAGWKIMGWSLSITGGSIAGIGLATDSSASDMLVTMGGVTLGLGLLSFVAGSAATAPTEWRFHVTGDVVKSTTCSASAPSLSDALSTK